MTASACVSASAYPVYEDLVYGLGVHNVTTALPCLGMHAAMSTLRCRCQHISHLPQEVVQQKLQQHHVCL